MPAPDIYTVRARIIDLPDPAHPTYEFAVHHENIPSFKNAKGEVVGMGSMEMPFPLAAGVSLDGFKVGDRVTLTFAVWRSPRIRFEVTRIEKLPEGAKLDFE